MRLIDLIAGIMTVEKAWYEEDHGKYHGRSLTYDRIFSKADPISSHSLREDMISNPDNIGAVVRNYMQKVDIMCTSADDIRLFHDSKRIAFMNGHDVYIAFNEAKDEMKNFIKTKLEDEYDDDTAHNFITGEDSEI